MSVSAKLSLPFAFALHPAQPALEHAFGGMTTLFSAPPGYLLTGHLAGLLHERQIPAVWLRLEPEDQDPAMLLSDLAVGIDAAFPGVGARTLQEMRRQPGPLFGWAPLFFGLARNLVEQVDSNPTRPRLAEHPAAYAPPVALIIQHIDALLNSPAALELLWDHFLPFLPAAAARILTSHMPMPRGSVPGYVVQHGIRDLRLADDMALTLARPSGFFPPGAALADNTLRRLVALTEGRGGTLDGLLTLGKALRPADFTRMVQGSRSAGELLSRAARGYLETCSTTPEGLLALALRLEYINPEMAQAALGEPVRLDWLPAGWLQPLADDWARLHCAWREPLRAALSNKADLPRPSLKQAADYLLNNGAYETAVPLLLDLGYLNEAAQVIVQVAEPLLDNGKWQTLSGWLARLPARVRTDWPWLVYAEGELSAARGQTGPARRIFATATRLFNDQKDYKGACRSLLTESSLAAWQDEMPNAEQYAQQAEHLAHSVNLVWYQGWAFWQLGVLAASRGQIGSALTHFQNALALAKHAEDPQMSDFIEQVYHLAYTQNQLQQQVFQHFNAYQSILQAEREASARLRFWLENPLEQSGSLLQQYGWSQAPLFLKLPPPAGSVVGASTGDAPATRHPPERLMAMLRGLLHGPVHPPPEPPFTRVIPATGYVLPLEPPVNDFALPDNSPVNLPPAQRPAERTEGTGDFKPTAPRSPENDIAGSAGVSAANSLASNPPLPPPPASADHTAQPAIISSVDNQKPVVGEPVTGALHAYLLGSFRVLLNGQVVESWPSGRGRALFAFLLSQHGDPLPREVIMDTFWPDVSSEAARNSLNVAVHSLRQSLKTLTARQVIIFRENTYGLNPDLPIWLDRDAFERAAQAEREESAQGSADGVASPQVIIEYERALSLYQGDFLAEFPYEDWAALERERLRMLYLETLDHLSRIYFNRGQYNACSRLCQLMLAHDNCREDAHCRLMRSYSRQGQGHLALRQYQACVEALRSELNVAPSPATIQLFEQIRRRETV